MAAKETVVGVVEHYFGGIGVAGIKITKGPVKPGDQLHFKGHTTDFTDTVASIQIKNKEVKQANKGDAIGLKVRDRVRENDKVFKVPA